MTEQGINPRPIFDEQALLDLGFRFGAGDLAAAHELSSIAELIIEIVAVSAFEYSFDGAKANQAFVDALSESSERQLEDNRTRIKTRMDEFTGEEHSLGWYLDEVDRTHPSVPGLAGIFIMAAAMEARIVSPLSDLSKAPSYGTYRYETDKNYEPSENIYRLLELTGEFDVSVDVLVECYRKAQCALQGIASDEIPALEPEFTAFLGFIDHYELSDQRLTPQKIENGAFRRPDISVKI